jgi:hypothetical protein
MRYIKTFEYRANLPLGQIYNGRFTNVLRKHSEMLDDAGIEYQIYVDEDKRGLDVVYIIINDEYKKYFFDTIYKLGYKPIDINELNFNKLAKYDTMKDYLKTKLQENFSDKIFLKAFNEKGEILNDKYVIIIKSDEYKELEKRNLVHLENNIHGYFDKDYQRLESEINLIRSVNL